MATSEDGEDEGDEDARDAEDEEEAAQSGGSPSSAQSVRIGFRSFQVQGCNLSPNLTITLGCVLWLAMPAWALLDSIVAWHAYQAGKGRALAAHDRVLAGHGLVTLYCIMALLAVPGSGLPFSLSGCKTANQHARMG